MSEKNVELTDEMEPDRVTLTDEEGDEINATITAIQTMVQEYMINYIIGQTDKTYEEFREELFEFGMQDVLDTYQAAYDRYLAR